MNPPHAGPLTASHRLADGVRRPRRNFTNPRRVIDFANLAEKCLDSCLTNKIVNDIVFAWLSRSSKESSHVDFR
jgi:hypothetical protein